MKTLYALSLMSVLWVGFAAGCETSHSSSDKDTMLGGHKHEETTVTKNPITGDTSVEHKESKTNP